MTPSPLTTLVVDDEEAIRESLAAWLTKDGYRVSTAESADAALARIARQTYDLYLVDIKMPGMDGIELLTRIKEGQPDALIIIITAHGTVQTAVEAMKRGANDYICKPFDPEELSLIMERLAATKALREENTALREQLMAHQTLSFEGIVAQSEAMQAVFATIEDVAPTAAPVLVCGESGVGKELVAKALHFASDRAY